VDALVLDDIFGAGPVSTLPRLLLGIPHATRHVYALLRREEPAPRERPRLLVTAAAYAIPSQLGAYLGSKGSLVPRRLPGLHRFLGRGV
jgi:hypothetical protein